MYSRDHPQTVAAFVARINHVTKKDTAISPAKTMAFQKQRIDYSRLSRPRMNQSADDDFMGSALQLSPKALHEQSVDRELIRRPTPRIVKMSASEKKRAIFARDVVSPQLYFAVYGHGAEDDRTSEESQQDLTNSFGHSSDARRSTVSFAEFKNFASFDYRLKVTTMSHSAYTYARNLFVEIDDDGNGYLELHELLQFRAKYPKRLAKEVFDHLSLDHDGKVFIDEFIRVHFPNIPVEQIDSAIDAYEAKAQTVESLTENSQRQIQRMYDVIHRQYSEHTLENWVRKQFGDDEVSFLAVASVSEQDQLDKTMSSVTSSSSEGTLLRSDDLNAYQLFQHYTRICEMTIVEFVDLLNERGVAMRSSLRQRRQVGFQDSHTSEERNNCRGNSTQLQKLDLQGPIVHLNEPNVPFLLSVPISIKSFCLLEMDYFVREQNCQEISHYFPPPRR